MKKIILLLSLSLACTLSGCSEEKSNWPDSGISTVLPVPALDECEVRIDSDIQFSAKLNDAENEDYQKYVEKCQEKGFDVEAQKNTWSYEAFNDDGYKVEIKFRDSGIYISLDAPVQLEEIVWPSIGLAEAIPVPESIYGSIEVDSSSHFYVLIGDTSEEEFRTYINKCIDAGFDVNYSKGDDYFDAENAEGISLHIQNEGFNTMSISVYAADVSEQITVVLTEELTAEPTSENVTENTKAEDMSMQITTEAEIVSDIPEVTEEIVLSDDIRPEFKAAIESYEAFFDEYCEFMKKYNEAPDDLSLLSDYAEYMTQYAETMQKMSDLDDGTLTTAELEYYLDANTRITKKLLEAAE